MIELSVKRSKMKSIWKLMTVEVDIFINMFILKWIKTFIFKCRDVDYNLESNINDKIGSGNDEYV